MEMSTGLLLILFFFACGHLLVSNLRQLVQILSIILPEQFHWQRWGTALAGIVYIAASQVIAGMFPNEVVANSGAPFALSASRIVGDWAAPFVSAFTAIACLTSLGSRMMLVGQAGRRAAMDGNFPAVFGETNNNGVPKKGCSLHQR